jgi:transposase
MNVTTGEVITRSIRRNDSGAFTQFLAMLDQCTAPHLRIRLVMDNGSSHTSRATRAWIAAHPRFEVTHTPKHASWLNMVEQWFSILTRRLLRRGDFTSRDDLDQQITDFTISWNETAHPFKWKYDADAEHARYLERHPARTSSPKARESAERSRRAVENFCRAALGSENSKPGFCAFVVLPGHHSAAYRHRAKDGVAPLDERRAGARQDGLPHGPVQLGEEARRGLLHLPQCGAVAAEEGDAGRLGLGDPG